MSDDVNINDNPKLSVEEDEYGFEPFARSIADSINNLVKPEGTTLALHGEWGSGKTSVVNFVKKYVDSDRIETSELNAWWHSDTESLQREFYTHLRNLAVDLMPDADIKDTAKKHFSSIMDRLRPAIRAGGALATGGSDAGGQAAEGAVDSILGQSLEKLHRSLSESLAKCSKSILIVIDDIDRLEPQQVLSVFKIVKSSGKLPNVVYLLVFDRDQVDQTIVKTFEGSYGNYLEKIVQLTFDIPLADKRLLTNALMRRMTVVSGRTIDVDTFNVFVDSVMPFIKIPRDIVRLHNSVSFLWPRIRDEVNFADVVALEAVRLKEYAIWEKLVESAKKYEPPFGLPSAADSFLDGDLKALTELAVSTPSERIEVSLKRLFPQLQDSTFLGGFYENWHQLRMVCIPKHFCTYIARSIGIDDVSILDERELIANLSDAEHVCKVLVKSAEEVTQDGSSKVMSWLILFRKYFELLESHCTAKHWLKIFENMPDIDIDHDKESFLSNLHELMSIYLDLLTKINTQEKRDKYTIESFSAAPVLVIYRFLRDVSEKDSIVPKDFGHGETIVSEELYLNMVAEVQDKLKDMNYVYTSYDRMHLMKIFYAFKRFGGSSVTVQNITSSLLSDVNVIKSIAEGHMQFSRGVAIGEMSDRAERAGCELYVENLSETVSVDAFIESVERLKDQDDSGVLNLFSDLWQDSKTGS